MNPSIDHLHPYPFEKLRQLFNDVSPNANLTPIALSIGEPKHPSPDFVQAIMQNNSHRLANYPLTKGLPELRSSISTWLHQRFNLASPPDPETEILPVNGTREALFAFAQCVVDRSKTGTVLMPNPFYQIYEGAAILAGAEPVYLSCDANTDMQPDFHAVTDDQWQRCQLLYICTPGNPTGAVLSKQSLQFLIEKAQEHNFIIASDECYSEIYSDTPPIGLLQACAELGHRDYKRCVVFHSLSKRSNLPGLRSGFVAGDKTVLAQFLKYRTYHGCAMPIHHQLASIAAWEDEDHVAENRARYCQKFKVALDILGDTLQLQQPEAGFYLWPQTPNISDERFAQLLLQQQNVVVLPGRYLGRTVKGINPGENRIRMALVAPLEECEEACQRIKTLLESI